MGEAHLQDPRSDRYREQLFVCPVDHGPLEKADPATLSCPKGHAWPIVDGVPVFIEAGATYADAFGAQWKRYAATQLDSHTGQPISRDRLLRCLGGESIDHVRALGAARVLEAGCGAGRFTEILLDLFPTATLVSIDYSEAAAVNARNFPISERHRVGRADLRRLPLLPGQSDLVVCLGVIQHTPAPEEAIAALYGNVAPGGWLVIDHYSAKLGYLLSTKPLVRAMLKRLRPGRAFGIVEGLVEGLLPIHRAVSGNRGLRLLVSRFSPITTYYHMFPGLAERFQREWAALDTHDLLTDWYKHFRSCRQIGEALASLGAESIAVWAGGNGVEARCRKPITNPITEADAPPPR